MGHLVEIQLCMGSSCYARGNDRLLEAVERAVRENAWEDKVRIAGSRCRNLCGDGPNIYINGTLHRGVSESSVVDLIMEAINPAYQS